MQSFSLLNYPFEEKGRIYSRKVLEEFKKKAAEERLRTPSFIADLLADPLYFLASIINAKYFEGMVSCRQVSIRAVPWQALRLSIGFPQRLAIVCRSGLSALLLKRLIISFGSKYIVKHAIAVLSRKHFVGFKNREPSCVSTLRAHRGNVRSVAFHPSAPYIATGSDDDTAKLWLLNADCSAATCVSTLQGHTRIVSSVAFHLSAPYIVTGSHDKTAKLWLLNAD